MPFRGLYLYNLPYNCFLIKDHLHYSDKSFLQSCMTGEHDQVQVLCRFGSKDQHIRSEANTLIDKCIEGILIHTEEHNLLKPLYHKRLTYDVDHVSMLTFLKVLYHCALLIIHSKDHILHNWLFYTLSPKCPSYDIGHHQTDKVLRYSFC